MAAVKMGYTPTRERKLNHSFSGLAKQQQQQQIVRDIGL